MDICKNVQQTACNKKLMPYCEVIGRTNNVFFNLNVNKAE